MALDWASAAQNLLLASTADCRGSMTKGGHLTCLYEGVEESRMLQPLLPDDDETAGKATDDDDDHGEDNKQTEKVRSVSSRSASAST